MLYAVGDIHGYTDQLDRALRLIETDGGAEAPIVFMGDYVDRGPDGRGVIERLMTGQAEGRDWTCLIGNHDLMFWRFVTTGETQDRMIKSGKGWLHHRLGGNTTLASYLTAPGFVHPNGGGIETLATDGLDPTPQPYLDDLIARARAEVPQSHLDWIANGPRLHQAEDHLFVHAGIRPGVALSDQSEEDLVWIREGWVDHEGPLDHMVVHGHTALDFPQHHGTRINLDGGAGYGRTLVPAVLDGGAWFTLDESGRTPLIP